MSLDTGAKLLGFNFKELTISKSIIDRVHDLANVENAPDLNEDGCPTFEWEIGDPVHSGDNLIADELDIIPQDINNNSDDESDDSNYEPDDDDSSNDQYYSDDSIVNSNNTTNNIEIIKGETNEPNSDETTNQEVRSVTENKVRSATNDKVRSVTVSNTEKRSDTSEDDEHSNHDNAAEEARSETANEHIIRGK